MRFARTPALAGALALTVTIGATAAVSISAPQSAASQATAPAAHAFVSAKDMAWRDSPTSPGMKVAVLHGDPRKEGEFVLRLKMQDGYLAPPHWHPTDENLTVISGTFLLGMGDQADLAAAKTMTEGDFVYMPKTMHHYAAAKGETVVQLHGMGPFVTNFVNPADDPAKKAGTKPTGSR